MDIGLIITWKYPQATMDDFTVVQEAGEQPKLIYWNEATLGPQPTTEQFRSWWLDAEKNEKKRILATLAERDYRAIFTEDGMFMEMNRDRIMQAKLKREIGAISSITPTPDEQSADAAIAVETKWKDKRREVNQFTQGTDETVEDAVNRVRAISW